MNALFRVGVASLLLVAACESSDPGCPNIFTDGNIVFVDWTEISGGCGDLDPLEIDTGFFGKDPAGQCSDAVPVENPSDRMCSWDLTSACSDVYGSWTFIGQLEYVGGAADAFEGTVTFRRFDTAGDTECLGTYRVRYRDR
jgi:hypothetical protein